MLTIPRRSFLLGSAATFGAGLFSLRNTARADGERPPRRLIIAMAGGGWDPTAALDPKPGLTTVDVLPGDIQDFSGLPIYVDGTRPMVTQFFEQYAPLCTVVNGIQVQSLNHPDCAKRMLTGTPSDTAADMGAITAHALAPDLAAPYLVLGQNAFSGPYASIAARAGTANQLGTLLSPERAYAPADNYLDFTPRLPLDGTEEDLIRAHVSGRAQRELDARGLLGENQRRLEDFMVSLDRGDTLAGGLGDDQLRIVVLHDSNLRIAHAVLVVLDGGKAWVLDNQIDQVIDAERIRHYRPYYSINASAYWLHR